MYQIQSIKISGIHPYENNPRKNEKSVEKVAKSIEKYGFQSPIILDKNNVIICGHTRLKAAIKLGYLEVPCIIASDLNEEQVRELRLADNKSSEDSKWDDEKLEFELNFLDNEFKLDFGFVFPGFEDSEKLEDDDFDEGQYLSNEPYSKQGDIYLLGNHRLMCGDSTNPDMVRKLMDGGKANLVVTDPPYNVDIENSDGLRIKNDNMEDEAFHQFLVQAFTNLKESLVEGGSFYVWYASRETINFFTALAKVGLANKQQLIWEKNALVLGRSDYQWIHEPCIYGWKEGASHVWYSDRSQTTVFHFDKPKHNDLHPTMKPLDLFGYQIQNSSKKGDIVLDLFSGSGTTIIACEQTERCARGMEFDEKYADVIVKRYIRFKNSLDDCYLLRGEEKIHLSEIDDFKNTLN